MTLRLPEVQNIWLPRRAFRKSLGLSGAQPDTLMGLLERAAISETHRALMGTVVERISSAKSGLNEAFTSLPRGFEVRKNVFYGSAHAKCALYR